MRQSAKLALCMIAAAACSKQSEHANPAVPDVPTAGTAGMAGPSTPPTDVGSAAGSGQPSSTAGRPATDAGMRSNMPDATSSTDDSGVPDGAPHEPETPTPTRCAEMTGERSSNPGSGYPGGRWTVSAPTHASVVEENVRVVMSDGVALVGDVAYPADLQTRRRATDKFPVILTQNPYGAAAFGAPYGEIFVTHGYIFASFDVRGTGRSAGTHDMFSPREAEDGAALVAWAAKLEGSDGRVGLQGCSQLGINQLETATQLGPDSPVKAMIPACASGDFYRDTAFDNGIPTIVGSLLATSADMSYYRDYWKTRDRLARAPAIARADIPTLLWSGWHEPGALGSLELYTALQNLAAGRPVNAQITADQTVSGRYQVILGDWAHGGGLDLGIQLQWYDTWIKGVDTGLATNTKSPLHLAELGGSKRWINSRCYPLVESYTALFLASGGKLGMSAETTEGQDMLRWSSTQSPSGTTLYTSEPFADGAMLAGPVAARLQVSSSNTNVQLLIEVLDRAPNGTLSRISQGSVLGTLRRTDPGKSWSDAAGLPKRPFLELDEDEALTRGQSTTLEVPLWPTVWSVEPNHSLVVRLSTQPNADDCGNPLGVPVGCFPTTQMTSSLSGGTYAVQRGGKLGSLISLPLVKHGAFASATSAVSATAAVKASSPDARPLPIDW
ncbi:MAG TPA: CocE/NonD family hydrolase [Polyangiales bacterium]|nr:CocE/NonD family hydrolase [Polyangiales bacterium]